MSDYSEEWGTDEAWTERMDDTHPSVNGIKMTMMYAPVHTTTTSFTMTLINNDIFLWLM
jgi:hypothetical protein